MELILKACKSLRHPAQIIRQLGGIGRQLTEWQTHRVSAGHPKRDRIPVGAVGDQDVKDHYATLPLGQEAANKGAKRMEDETREVGLLRCWEEENLSDEMAQCNSVPKSVVAM